MLAHVTKSHRVDMCDGTKLDSVNILRYCTYRQLADEEAQAIADGDSKVEKVSCADVDVSVDNIKPLTPVALSNGNSIKTSKENDLANHGELNGSVTNTPKPSDWMSRYPTIILTKGGAWIELRCDLCGVSF
jgi:hypothetical protein